MATPKIEPNESNKATEDQIKAPEATITTPPATTIVPPAAPEQAKAFSQAEKNPSDWEIVAAEEDDQIIATNNRTNRVFKGCRGEFLSLVRG